MIHPLRDYQQDQLNFITRNHNENVCIQSPTGTGKSNVIIHSTLKHIENNDRVLIIAPKQELCTNIAKNLSDVATVAYSGVYPILNKPVLVSTPITAKKYIETFKPTRLIIDECHHSAANNLDDLISSLKIPTEGYTATPNRLDNRGLYKYYKKLYQSPSIEWFIKNGYLSPFKLIASKAPLLISSSGDSLQAQESVFLPQVKDSIKAWLDTARGLKTLVFCPTIYHAEITAKEFQNAGIRCAVIHSKNSQHRIDVLDQFRNGLIDVLINVEFFTEGVDLPDLQCLLLLRFSFSTALYLQMVGRVLRYHAGKVALILDFANNSYYHGAVDAPFDWSLDGERVRLNSNHQQLHNHCVECDALLIHKKFLIAAVKVCCIKCHAENYLTLPNDGNGKKSKLSNVFNIEELHHLEDTTITQLTRIIFASDRKYDSKQKKIAGICAVNIDSNLKRKALKVVGMTDKEISIYFD